MSLVNRRAALFAIASAGFSAPWADGKIEPVKAANEEVEIRASAVVGREAAKTGLGIDPGVDLVMIEVQIRPKTDSGIQISRDDFVLISRRDGQRSSALHPSQIAGSGTITVQSRQQGASGGTLGQRRGPIWGGIPGTGDRPRRVGGDNDVAAVSEAETKSTVSQGSPEDNPILAALRAKELAQGKTTEPARGLLYYILEGKHRLKDLELMYKTPEGNLMLDFQK